MSALSEIIAHFGVEFDDKALKKGSNTIGEFISSLKGVAGAVGAAFAVDKIYGFVHGLTEEADALAKQARTMGVSLDAMQEWNYAAMMQGVSAEALQASLARLSAGKYDKKGMAELLGNDFDKKGKSGADLLGEIADKLAAMPDVAKRNELAMKVLGRSYKSLMPLLLDGSKGINELREEFRAMGGGFSEEFAEDADKFGDNIDRLKTRWKLFGIMIVTRVLPDLVRLSQWFVMVVPKIVEFTRRTNVLELAAAALALGGIAKLSSSIGGLGGALKGLVTKNWQVLALVAALVALEDVFTFFQGGESFTGGILNKLFDRKTVEWMRKEVPAFFAEMWADLDKVALIGKIVGVELKSQFLRTFAAIQDAVAGAFNLMLEGTKSVITYLGKIRDEMSGGDAGAKWAESVKADIDKNKLGTGNEADAVRAANEERLRLAGVSDKLDEKRKANAAADAARTEQAAAQKAYDDAVAREEELAQVGTAAEKKKAEIAADTAEKNLKNAIEVARITKQAAFEAGNIAAAAFRGEAPREMVSFSRGEQPGDLPTSIMSEAGQFLYALKMLNSASNGANPNFIGPPPPPPPTPMAGPIHVENHITVPPTTPEALAGRVAAAAGDATLRATGAALVPGG